MVRMLRTDELTGLCTSFYFEERLRDDMLRSERYGWPLAVLILDLDRFDQVEQKFNRIICDNVVVTIATMLRKFARNTDIVSRIGDTKFALLLPGTGGEGAQTIAERLHQRVSTHLFSTPDGKPLQISCSVGLAEYNSEWTDAADFLAAAEKALSTAQSEGGGRWAAASAAKA
jgi:diguanylate cyclase (GGDEF)-like protein